MPSFPTVSLVESFERAETAFAQAGWAALQGTKAKGRTSVAAGWWPTSASPNIDGVYHTTGEFTEPGVCTTVNGAGSTESPRNRAIWCCLSNPGTEVSGYKVQVRNTSEWILEKHSKSATGTELAKVTGVTAFASGDKFGISVEGGKVYGWQKKGAEAWKVIVEAADSAFNKGLIGVSGVGNIESTQGQKKLEAGNGSITTVQKLNGELTSGGTQPQKPVKNFLPLLEPHDAFYVEYPLGGGSGYGFNWTINRKTTHLPGTKRTYGISEEQWSLYFEAEEQLTYSQAEGPAPAYMGVGARPRRYNLLENLTDFTSYAEMEPYASYAILEEEERFQLMERKTTIPKQVQGAKFSFSGLLNPKKAFQLLVQASLQVCGRVIRTKFKKTGGGSSFPTTESLDTFVRAAEKPLGTNEPWKVDWVSPGWGANLGRIFSTTFGWIADTAEGAAESAASSAYWKLTEFANPAVSWTFDAENNRATSYTALWCCLKPQATRHGYRLKWVYTGTTGKYKLTLEKWVNGTRTELGTTEVATESSSAFKQIIGISAVNGVVKAWYHKGTSPKESEMTVAIEASDTEFTKGFVGMEGTGSAYNGQLNFRAGSAPIETVVTFIAELFAPYCTQTTFGTLTTNVFKQVIHKVEASLEFAGRLSKVFTLTKHLEGALTFAGALGRNIAHGLTAALTSAGKAGIARILTAALSFRGGVERIADLTMFPTVTSLDTFERTENPLNNSGKWTILPGALHIGQTEGFYRSSDTGIGEKDGAYWNVQQFRAPVGVAGKLGSGGAGRIGGLIACLNPAESGSYYALQFSASGLIKVQPSWTLIRFDKGVETQLQTTKAASREWAGLSVRSGGRVGVWFRESTSEPWTLLYEVIDTTYTKGYSGVEAISTGTVSNFESGTTTKLGFFGSIPGEPPVGSVNPRLVTVIVQVLTGALSFAGSLGRNVTHGLTGSLSFAGTLPRAITHGIKASTEFLGKLGRSITHGLTSSVSSAGTLGRSITRRLQASTEFVVTLSRSVTHGLSAQGSFQGALPRNIRHGLAGALSFLGSLATIITRVHVIEAALSFAGSLPRNIRHALEATVTFSTRLGDYIIHVLSGSLDFAGNLTKVFTLTKRLEASLDFLGSMQRNVAHALTATLSFAGSLGRSILRGLTGTLNFSGTLQRTFARTLEAALSFAGSVGHNVSRALTATVSFVGTLPRSIQRSIQAALTMTGTLANNIVRSLRATLEAAGTLAPKPIKTLVAQLDFSGTLTKVFAIVKRLVAELEFFGLLAVGTFRQLIKASLDFAGTLPKRFDLRKALEATFDFAGTLSRQTTKSLVASLSFLSSLGRSIQHGLSASLSFAGRLGRNASATLRASLASSGALGRSISRRVSGALSTAGALPRGILHGLRSVLDFLGEINTSHVMKLFASLSFKGRFSNVTQTLVAVLDFAASTGRNTTHGVRAALDFLGRLTPSERIFTQRLRARLTFGKAHIIRSYLRVFQGRADVTLTETSPTLTHRERAPEAVEPDELTHHEPPASIEQLAPGTIEGDLERSNATVQGELGLEGRDQFIVTPDLPDPDLDLEEMETKAELVTEDLAQDTREIS
jgi:hypothetical protein